MDSVSGSSRIKVLDQTVKYGSIEIETTFTCFVRGREFFTVFSCNGEPLDTIVSRAGIDIDKIQELANDRCLAAYVDMKKKVEKKKQGLFVSDRWLKRRLDEAEANYD